MSESGGANGRTRWMQVKAAQLVHRTCSISSDRIFIKEFHPASSQYINAAKTGLNRKSRFETLFNAQS